MTAARTPLTYYGGKQRLAREIDALIPRRRSYVEPFAGGAALLFGRDRVEREVLGDLDEAIVTFWRVVRDRPLDLVEALEMTPFSRTEWESARVGIDDPELDDVERARRLLVLVDQSFGRTCESWSVPSLGRGRGRWQPGSWIALPDRVRAVVGRLSGVAIEHDDGVAVIGRYDGPEVTIYVDPPYVGAGRLSPAKGYREDVTADLWPRLTDALLAVEHAAVALSGYPCEHTDELEAAGWEPTALTARRGVGGEIAPETLWRNPICIADAAQSSLDLALSVSGRGKETR